jgi:CheY-specific phosphatase CheX
MTESQKEILSRVFEETLEQSAFMFLESADKETLAVDNGAVYLQSFISFTGPENGLISLTAPEPLVIEMAANILGVEPEDDFVKEQSSDAIGEMINVICGHYLTETEGDVPVFDLSVPTMTKLLPKEWDDLRKLEGTLAFIINEQPALLHLAV